MTRSPFRTFLALIFLTVSAAASAFSGQWKLYPVFDDEMARLIETPDRVYILANAQPYGPGVPECPAPQGFLYVWDKAEQELTPYNKSNYLTESLITRIEYNAVRGYLFILYDDYNIDILFDDGRLYNIPALKNATIPSSKEINDVTFDSPNSTIYIATDFGYISIDDRRMEVAESRIYNRPLRSVASLMDRLVVIDEDGLILWALKSSPRFMYDEFQLMEFSTDYKPAHSRKFFQISPSLLGVIGDNDMIDNGSESCIWGLAYDSPEYTGLPDVTYSTHPGATQEFTDQVTPMANGANMVRAPRGIAIVSATGGVSIKGVAIDLQQAALHTWNGTDVWVATPRKGIARFQLNGNSEDWSRMTDYFMPNASTAFICDELVYHPTYGMMAVNHGNETFFPTITYFSKVLLCGLKNGTWTRYGLPYICPEDQNMLFNPNGMAFDPRRPDYVYFGSSMSGIGGYSIADPSQRIHFSASNDVAADTPSFIEAVPVQNAWERSVRFCGPKFDSEGNLWSLYNNLDSSNPSELWVWPRANIDASSGASSYKPWVVLPLSTSRQSTSSKVLPLTSSGNTNRVMVATGGYAQGLIMYDHGGNLSSKSGHRTYQTDTFTDQDSQPVPYNYIHVMYEDPSSGLIWVGTDSGLFTVNPNTFPSSPSTVNRIKVAREDGTQLADYLLNGVCISKIVDDPFGRKWFATVGGGVVCTSADGRTIKGQWTAEDSMLPSDNVYSIAWNEETGSLMISTDKGLAEFFPSGEGNGRTLDELRVFPNPVHPYYYGWITVDGLTEGSIVKVCDAHGNLVRELGRAEGGTIQWDGAGMGGQRVASGVYYVMASDDSGNARIGKVLVVN